MSSTTEIIAMSRLS